MFTRGSEMRFKPLEWSVSEDGTRYAAPSPTGFEGYLVFYFEEGKYWSGWNLNIPGLDSEEEIKFAAQEFHEQKLGELFDRWIET